MLFRSTVDVWGGDAVLAYVPPAGLRQMALPSYGYTYQLSGHPLVEPSRWDADIRSWKNDVLDEFSAELVGADAGFLFQDGGLGLGAEAAGAIHTELGRALVPGPAIAQMLVITALAEAAGRPDLLADAALTVRDIGGEVSVHVATMCERARAAQPPLALSPTIPTPTGSVLTWPS